MGDKPIIFSAPMVRALLDGRKTQTRRVLTSRFGPPHERADALDCVRFEIGDRLYVREQCAIWGRGPEREPVEFPVVYAADDAEWADIKHDARNSKTGDEWKIRPSIHMPRWASRLTLTVTDVRVQRLQEISEADAVAEGIDAVSMEDVPRQASMSRRSDFAAIWNSLHGPDAWAANPWVVAVSFTVQRGNIDQIGGPHD